MALTFGEVRRLTSQFAGRGGACSDSEQNYLFARQVMEHLLHSGNNGSIRLFNFVTQNGCFSCPPDVQTPLEVRVDGEGATISNKWFSFTHTRELDRCRHFHEVFAEEPNLSPLVYDLPPGGSVVGVLGTCAEKEDAFVIVSGSDITGREIITTFNGEQVVGERFRLKKGELRFGQVKFGNITSVLKSKTVGYCQLWAVDPDSRQQQFLADYSPVEEKPLYRRFKVLNNWCKPISHISLLARIRLKDNYTDNEIVPFESQLPVIYAAQRLQAEMNNDVETAQYKKRILDSAIEEEAAYKRVAAGSPVRVYKPLSGGAIKRLY